LQLEEASMTAVNVCLDRPSVFDAGPPSLDYEHAPNPDAAQRIIRQVPEQAPIALGPHGPEVLCYDLVRIVLRDNRFAMPKGMLLAAQGITSGPVWDRVCRLILSLDGAEHQRLRRLVAKAFTPKATARLRALIGEVITELVDPLTAVGQCDVVADIARQYPIPIICALLGAPREDWQLFSVWVDDIMKAFDWNVAEDTPAILAAWDALDAYLEDMIAYRRTTLTDDLISDLIRAEDGGDRLTHDELLSLAALLLIAGTDTTRNQLAASVGVLCDHPEQWALLAQHPELAPSAVEETMRHCPIALNTIRVAVEDVELGDVMIPAGTFVIANTSAANRDPAVYDDPDRLDITRESPPAMLTFGGGVHYCLGTHLARLELIEALTVITRRMPNAHRTGPALWKPLSGITGPTTLPIEFDGGH
jgi:cytochrome P450